MATKPHAPPPTVSRVRFGFGSKQSRSRFPPELSLENANDRDWYIPYNGPYELPPPTAPRSPNRESWGPLLGSVLGHFGSAKSSAVGHERSDGRRPSEQSTSALPNSGAFSSHPYRMNASSPDPAGTPGPATMNFQGRGAGAGAGAQPPRGTRPTPTSITSSTAFANIDTTGGVGESPTPAQRSSPLHTSPPPNALNRLSLGSFLTFGGSMRKSRSDSVYASRRPSGKRSRTGTPTPDPLHSNRAAFSEAQRPRSHSQSPLHPDKMTDHRSRRRSHTLIGTSMAPAQPSSPSHDSSQASYYTRESPLSTHPYANTLPSSRTEAPVLPPPASRPLDKGKGVDRSYMFQQPPVSDTLNNPEVPAHLKPASRTSLFKTISTPNLRNLSRGFSSRRQTSSRGKYRWLSPETWCDALLFPRPRFLAYIDDDPPPQSFSPRPTSSARPPEVNPASERPRNHQMAMRGSRSAVNLHAPNLEFSHGPPRAEPMLMARRGPLDMDGRSPADRPRSFAQDDLALPSPVPSLAKVLEMGASFDRERAAWKAHAARPMQSSKLTRSLGRSRSQSVGRARAQLKDAGGVGFLATKTLLGNQFAAPTVHARTPSDGALTQQTRSGTSHARTTSSGGHSRAGSKGRAALRAATGLCISDEKISPQDERTDLLARNDDRGKVIRVGPNAPSPDVGPSPSPPVTSNSNVGVALSSPPASADGGSMDASEPVYVPNHPYAQSGHSSRRSYTRSSHDYAGPHPSAVSIALPAVALANDMSARHRLPPQVALHPYASALAYPNTSSSQHPTPILPVLPKELHQSPPEPASPPRPTPQDRPKPRPQLGDARETGRGALHAYALGNRSSGEPLAFADALSFAMRRRGSADSGLGDSENLHEVPTSSAQPHAPLPHLALTAAPERRRSDIAQAHDSTFLSLQSHTSGSSPLETVNPQIFTASMLSYSRHPSAQGSLVDEPIPGSRASSPQQSPRPFSTIEDLDRYRNLFYRPRGSGSSRTPSSEHRRVLPRDTGSFTGVDGSSNSRVSGGSGFASLTRQLSIELEAIQDMPNLDGASGSRGSGSSPPMWGLRYGGLRGGDASGSRTDPNAVLSVAPDSEMNSLYATTLPLSLHQGLGRQSEGLLTINVPQDVDSRTSSVLDRSEMEDTHHDEVVLRMGTIEAVATPVTTVPAYRLSFSGIVDGGRSQESLLRVSADEERSTPSPMLIPSPIPQGSRSSLFLAALPSATTEVTRSSYLTDGTGTSRMSGLSDFPAPPTQTVVSSDRVEILKSYFGDARSRPASSHTQTDRASGTGTVAAAPQPRRPASPSRRSDERSALKVDVS
ncbi:hypothetical protein BC827DRAFT_1268453 [Russula dissimulans]|nr:hypothetical protein BC827DRAFT_1268453 [Russula dissimulans]